MHCHRASSAYVLVFCGSHPLRSIVSEALPACLGAVRASAALTVTAASGVLVSTVVAVVTQSVEANWLQRYRPSARVRVDAAPQATLEGSRAAQAAQAAVHSSVRVVARIAGPPEFVWTSQSQCAHPNTIAHLWDTQDLQTSRVLSRFSPRLYSVVQFHFFAPFHFVLIIFKILLAVQQ